MKKVLCLLFCFNIILILICSGCNNKSSGVTAITSGLKFTAEISYLDKCYEYKTEILNSDKNEITISLTEAATEIKFFFKDNTVTICYGELEYKAELSALPEGVVLDFLYSVFNNAHQNKDQALIVSDKYFIQGDTDKYEYKMYLGQTGLPLKIEDKTNNISVIIKNAAIL